MLIFVCILKKCLPYDLKLNFIYLISNQLGSSPAACCVEVEPDVEAFGLEGGQLALRGLPHQLALWKKCVKNQNR